MSSFFSKIDRRSTLPLIAATLALLVLGVVACQPQGERQSQQVAVDTSQIRATFDSLRSAFEQAVAEGDYDAQADIFTADAVYSPPMSPPIRGRDSIRPVLERTIPPEATADVQPMEMRILGPDWVYEFGTTTLSFTPEGADQPRKMTGTYSTLFHRTENGWKATHEAFSSHQPPPGAQ